MIQFNTQTKHQTFFKNIFLKFSIFKQTELIYILFFLIVSTTTIAQNNSNKNIGGARNNYQRLFSGPDSKSSCEI